LNRVLIVDDDRMVRFAISENLKDEGFIPVEAASGKDAIDIYRKEKPASVILDLKMPGMDGMETLKEMKRIDQEIPVIINTAHGDVPTAVEAIKLGAYDFITKPPDFDRLIFIIKRATEKFDLDKKIGMLRDDVETSLEYLLGKSSAIKKVVQQIHQISHSNFSVILQGETGTGKSFIARAIHNLSKRQKGPFVTIDIGAMPETLVESELFGYEKGAFTGAGQKKKGFFEMADGGTILIDELQNLSPYVQSKLLNAVEERCIVPLGSTRPVKIDVRIVGATNTDILKAVREKKSFREDLFYRLSEFMIYLPPLRERVEDISFFAEKFCMDVAEDLNKKIHSISPEALNRLRNHTWPGNIRELKNVMRRAVLLSDKEIIQPEHIEFLIKNTDSAGKDMPLLNEVQNLSLTEIEKAAIKKVLHMTGGNKSKTASVLKIDYSTLLRKLKNYGI
jgi:two-component system response regulator AtoC